MKGRTRLRVHHRCLSLAALCKAITLVACTAIAFAQSTGSIQGTVSERTGTALPLAAVVVTNQQTGETRTLKTDNAGLYVIPSLIPGSYRVEVQAAPMARAVANNVVVSVGTSVTQNFNLEIGITTKTVVQIVQPDSPLLDNTSVSVGSVVDGRTVQEIPLNGRHFVDLALLTPGSVTPPQDGFLTSPLRGEGSFAFNSAGAREGSVNFMINGINMNDLWQNAITFQPSINTVSEFKVDNSTYSAEYGRNAGSVVNIATRNGTNQFHGEIHEFLRNDAMDARNFANPVGDPQLPFKRNQFGGDGGGPLKKDKAFLFLSYEGLVQRQSAPLSTPVLSAAQRATKATYDPTIQGLIGLIPTANSPGNVFVGSAAAPVNIQQGTANFTQNISDSHRFNAYYAMQHDQRTEPPSTDGNNLPGFGDTREGWRQFLSLNETAVISPTLVNEARAGFNRIHIVIAPQTTLSAESFGIDNGPNAYFGLPQININGGTTEFGGINNFPQGRGDSSITLSDTLAWTHGSHSIKLGPQYQHVISDSFAYTPGTFTFSNMNAFLSDQAIGFTTNGSNGSARLHVNSIGAFVQDIWRVKPRLTLDLGLRYEWNGTPTEAENRFVVFDPSTVTLQQVGSRGGPSRAYKESALNFEPRVGFALDLFGTGKTIVRSAYAIFVDQPITGLAAALASNPPFASPVSFSPTITIPTVSFGNAFSLASGAVSPVSVAHNYRNAYVQSWNFNIQQGFGNNYALMAGYFGSKGTGLNIARNYNQPINGIRPYAALSAHSPFDAGRPLDNITVYESVGSSSYNALWLTFQKRFSKGLQFNSSYTFSKSIDDNSRDLQGVVVQDSYHLRGDRGLSDFDARHRWVLSGVYDFPFKGNRLLDGWEVSLIEQLQSGNPANFHTTNNTFTGLPTLRPSVTGPVITGYNPAVNGNATNVWYLLNTTVFYNQGNAFGNLGRNVVIGPGFSNLDLALVKDTKLNERITWQFRADAFDLFNKANYGQPTETFGSPVFFMISNTRFPPGDSGSSRQLQLAMKLVF